MSITRTNKNHGILFLKNRSEKLKKCQIKMMYLKLLVNRIQSLLIMTMRMDLFRKSINKRSYHKLGQNIVKENNVLF